MKIVCSKKIIVCCYLLVLVYAFINAISYFHLTTEDSWISYKYARNLINGFGLVENPFDETQEGYSNLLLIILIYVVNKVTNLDINYISKCIGICSSFLIYVINYNILRLSFNDRIKAHWYNILFILCLASSNHYNIWITSGLETVFYSFILFLFCYLSFLYFIRGGRVVQILITLTAFAAFNTRPEATILIVIFLITYLIYQKVINGGIFSRTAVVDICFPVIGYIILVSLLFIWRYLYFGSFLANPSYVKLALAGWGSGLREYYWGYLVSKNLAFLIVFILSISLVTIKLTYQFLCVKRCSIQDLLILILMLFVGYCPLFCYVSGGDYMAHYRFIIPYYPFMVMLLLLIPQYLNFKVYKFAISLLGLIMVYSGVQNEGPYDPRWWKVDFISPNRIHELNNSVHNQTVVKLNDLMKKNPNEYFALSEYGYIPYHVNANGYDVMGLNQKEIARNYKFYDLNDAFKANRDFILAKLPKYIITWGVYQVNGSVKMSPAVTWFFSPYYDSEFFKKYYISNEIPKNEPENKLIFWERSESTPLVNYINAAQGKNKEFILEGAYLDNWIAPISRYLITPNSNDKFIYIQGYLPDINKYSNKEFYLEFKSNDKAVGDNLFFRTIINKTGIFEILIPINSAIIKKNEPFLLTIFSSDLKDGGQDKRKLSFILSGIGFRE